MSDIIRRQI